ncbi:MAG TPA: hypothetical protein EYP23_05635 [Thermoplasmata archaeon]|nr:hypothetical protein [Thermoplasmata archaeon]
MWIIAEKEKIYVDYFKQIVIRYPVEVSYERIERKESVKENITVNEPLKDELKYFINLVDKRSVDPEGNLGRENYYTTRVCELCLKSAQTGREMVVE